MGDAGSDNSKNNNLSTSQTISGLMQYLGTGLGYKGEYGEIILSVAQRSSYSHRQED